MTMKTFDLGELVFLAALWGGSYLFMRVSAPEFGPIALAAVRVAGASVVLVPLLAARQGLAEMRREWKLLALMGLLNNALPFAFFSFAALHITAGLSSIINATTPLWTALLAWWWMGQRLNPLRLFGLALGFGGVLFLAWDKASIKPGADHGAAWAVAACLAAALCYGTAANLGRRHMSHISALTVATGSLFFAALMLALPAALLWPAQMPGLRAWGSLLLLAVFCSALAYILYFRLMLRIGPSNTIAVTFLVPLFAVLWGYVFLGEVFTLKMALGCAVVLLGTALALGLVSAKRRYA